VGQPALADLHLLAAPPHVDLSAAQRVRMGVRHGAPGRARQHSRDDQRDHPVQVVGGQRRTAAPDAPQVDLVRLAHVPPVDGVAPEADSRHRQQHVGGSGGAGEVVEQGGDPGAGVGVQHPARRDVAAVAGVAGHRVGRVAQPVVVVGDGDDSGTGIAAHRDAPGAGQSLLQRRDDALQRVRSRGRVGQVPHGERPRELPGRDQGSVHGVPRSCERRAGEGRGARPSRPASGRNQEQTTKPPV